MQKISRKSTNASFESESTDWTLRSFPGSDCYEHQGNLINLQPLFEAVLDIVGILELATVSVSVSASCGHHSGAHFRVTAQDIRKLHLARRTAFGREEPGAADHDAGTTRPRRCDIEAVEVV